MPGSADRILRTLEAFGLHWDQSVTYQSQRIALYAEATDKLKSQGLTFECSCSRRDLPNADEAGYPGTCRHGPTRPGPAATRLRFDDPVVLFDDRIQGACRLEAAALGDFVVRRKDGIFSYQLAVVVDDAAQQVTDIVRGADLLPSTGWQIALYRHFRQPLARYAHLPVVVERTGEKLAKSRKSVPVDCASAGTLVAHALRLLNHPPPAELECDGPTGLLRWAASSWNPERLRAMRTVTPGYTGLAKRLGSTPDMD